MIGLFIKQNGQCNPFEYNQKDFINGFTRFIENRGVGCIECFDMISVDNGMFLFYGFPMGYNNFNLFEFPNSNVYGDAVVVKIDQQSQPVDCDINVFNSILASVDLNDYIVDDEMEIDDDTYDLEDPFIDNDDTMDIN